MRLRTPAKVTLALRVLAPRPDGYHEVQGALVPVSLYDTLAIDRIPDKGLSLEVDSPEFLGPVEDNLVWRAARRFESVAGFRLGAKLRLTKHIPSGAGLGGGSGNAAGTLVACNRLCGAPLSAAALHEAAAELGSDVPFFLAPRPCWVAGRGEVLRELRGFPGLHLLVVKPSFGIATGPAYVALAQTRHGRVPAAQEPPPLTTVDEVVAALHNDFEPVLFDRYSELAEVKASLIAAGARGALLSGTGSALFGIFETAAARDGARAELARAGRWQVFACATLAHHAYESES